MGKAHLKMQRCKLDARNASSKMYDYHSSYNRRCKDAKTIGKYNTSIII